MMHILGLFGMYFDAAVVLVTNSSLLFRLALAILYLVSKTDVKIIGHRVVQGEVLEIAPLFNEWQIEIAVTAE